MKLPPALSVRIPVVAVLAGLVFIAYGLGGGKSLAVVCDASTEAVANPAGTIPVHCQVSQDRRFGWLPPQVTEFNLLEVAVTSHLCDNTPRGGVRFCHRLTLRGDQGSVTLPEIRTPLNATTLTESLRSFMAGQGSDQLSWSTPHSLTGLLETTLLGLLLVITSWGLWSVQWPPRQPSPLALDGLATSESPLKKD